MTFRVHILPRAEREIRAAAHWIHAQSSSPAKVVRWARAIRAKIETLKMQPLRCPVAPDSENYGEEVRVLLYGKRRGVYRVLFAVRGNVVYVLTIRHSAQSDLMAEEDSKEPGDG